jgi:uncharacterized protein (DUF2345 family)
MYEYSTYISLQNPRKKEGEDQTGTSEKKKEKEAISKAARLIAPSAGIAASQSESLLIGLDGSFASESKKRKNIATN